MNNNKGLNLQFGYFLTYDIWEEALRLLNYQISEKKPPRPNRHYNNINFFYFEKIGDKVDELQSKDYFENKVTNNFFYGLEKEFFFYHYTVPKSGVGLRKYVFIGYPMTVLYYSVGLYLLKLTQQFIEDCKNESNIITSHYGGNLKFDKNEKINANHPNTYYKYHYDKFKKEVKRQAKEEPINKVVIKLDIQNYYETIQIDNMLDLINHYVKPSDLKKYNFDASTKEVLTFYFNFINNGNIGIPQGYTNTLSNFIGYFYLIFGDLFISDLIEEFALAYENIAKYQIIRYVDDTYISLTFLDDISKNEKENLTYELLKNISDCLYSKLNLRLNSKLDLFFLDSESERKALKNSLKRTSPELQMNDEDNTGKPQEKFDTIVREVKDINNQDLIFIFKDKDKDHGQFIETLNEVYDEAVEAITNKPDNLAKLEQSFINFNFDLFRIHPKVLVILVAKTTTAKEKFIDYLRNKKPLTTFDADLIMIFLTQTGFNEGRLIDKLKENKAIEPIITQFVDNDIICDKDYYDFSFEDICEFNNDINISEQVRLRVYYERLGEYSIALNHLLNELHAICRYKDTNRTSSSKNYNAKEVVKYLIRLRVNSEVKSKIKNLFDRRNKNPISHPGSDEAIAWAVSEIEYYEYKGFVRQCLTYILGRKENLVASPQYLIERELIKRRSISNIIFGLNNYLERKENIKSNGEHDTEINEILDVEILSDILVKN